MLTVDLTHVQLITKVNSEIFLLHFTTKIKIKEGMNNSFKILINICYVGNGYIVNNILSRQMYFDSCFEIFTIYRIHPSYNHFQKAIFYRTKSDLFMLTVGELV